MGAFLTCKEAALRLRFTVGYVRRLVREGVLKGYRPAGRSVLISEADLEDFVRRSPVAPTPADAPRATPTVPAGDEGVAR